MRSSFLATLAVLAPLAGTGGGCEEIVLVAISGEYGPPWYEPHKVEPAAAGRAFTGTIDGSLASTLRIKHGPLVSKFSNTRLIGNFSSRLRGTPTPDEAAALGPLASGQWHGQFSGTRNRKNGKIAVKGLVIATFTDATAGRACLRFKFRDRWAKKKGVGTITVVGGQGGAATLRGTTTARVKLGSTGTITVSGRISPQRGAPRGFSSSCSKLEAKFGLTPVG